MRFNIGFKIFSIAAFLVALMIGAAFVSVKLISDVRHELDIVSETQLPVSEAVAQVTVHILEQGILLQRLFTFAQELNPDPSMIEKTRGEYEAFRIQIGLEFEAARKLLTDRPKDSHHHTTIYDRLLPGLNEIEAHYRAYQDEAEVLISALDVGDRPTFEALLPELALAQDKVDQEVAAFRSALERLVEVAAQKANQDEILALQVNVGLTLLAIVLGLLFAAVITKRLVRSVCNLVSGTEAVEAGDLDTSVPRTTHDEIGSLTDSFNHMIGELRLKERIKDTFGKYLDPRVVTRLLDSPEVAEQGGERREMTVMFIDLKGFTSISEQLSPNELVRMINRFFNHMTKAISDHDGVVDKFMGDAVMAFWGPPFTAPDAHATLACQAALDAVSHLSKFREEVVAELGESARDLDIDLRIGISTGEMIVGTVGSDVSKSYTVIGDPVNLGARLEGANKVYGTHILVADETRGEVTDEDLQFREIDLLRVKGKVQPVRVFELVSPDGGLDPAACQEFERALADYRARDWEKSEAAFNVVDAAAGEDSASQVFAERAAHLRKYPPRPDWDGVWVLEEK